MTFNSWLADASERARRVLHLHEPRLTSRPRVVDDVEPVVLGVGVSLRGIGRERAVVARRAHGPEESRGRGGPSALDKMHIRAYDRRMELEWDDRKAAANAMKHGVDFADAVTILHDELAVTLPDEHPSEERYMTIGMDALGRVLVACWTWRDDRIRLISARRATPGERRHYEAVP